MGPRIFLLGFLLLTTALPAAAAPRPLTPELVPWNNGILPEIAVSGTGDFVVIWILPDGGSGDGGIYLRLFDALGRPKGAAQAAHLEPFAQSLLPKVAADEEGNFVIVWDSGRVVPGTGAPQRGDGDGAGIFAQRFDRRGRKYGRQIRVNRHIEGDQTRPGVAMDRDGSFVVAWRDCLPDGRCPAARAARFGANGARLGREIVLDVREDVASPLSVTVDAEGFSIGWTERRPVGGGAFVFTPAVARFTPSGAPSAPTYRLEAPGRFGWNLEELLSGDAGSLALLTAPERTSFQFFDPEGEPAGRRKVLRQAPGFLLTGAMSSSGHFAVLWAREGGSASGTLVDLLAQLFSPEGRPLGTPFQVNDQFAGPLSSQVSAALSDRGVLMVVWLGVEPESLHSSLVSRSFRLDLGDQ